VHNDSYQFDVAWTVTPINGEITDATLYLSTLFDLQYKLEVADIPGLLDWVNPYDAPAEVKSSEDNWAVANFTGTQLKDSYLGLYDGTNSVGYAVYFDDLPTWGNIGSLANRQIDALRIVYDFDALAANETVQRSYQTLTLSQSSYPALTKETLQGLFTTKTAPFEVKPRDFRSYIQRDSIGFIVYDRNELDTQIINSKILQLVYSNDRYVIFKILR